MARELNVSSEDVGIAWVAHLKFGSEMYFGVGSSKFEADEDLGAVVWLAIQRFKAKGQSLPPCSKAIIEKVPNLLMVGRYCPYLAVSGKATWLGYRPIIPYQC
jgi:hypothetical protein